MKSNDEITSDPLTLDALRYLQTPDGERLLAAATGAENDLNAQQNLRKEFPAQMCRAAFYLSQLRQRGSAKFERAEQMFFDRMGYEMATRAEVAQYRAWRLRNCGDVLDLCCGIGGDMLYLGQNGRVTGVDIDRRRIEMARLNCSAYQLDRAHFVAADVTTLRPRADAIFFDPARRSTKGRRRSGADYEPPLSFAQELRRHVPNLAIKVSPAIPEEELPTGGEVEFISSGGQCREGVLYWGHLATATRRATILPQRHILERSGQMASGPPVPVAPPGAYIYDPDPAVVRSHLLDELARELDAWKLDDQIAYLSGDALIKTPFARAYRILEVLPFQVKQLRRRLRQGKFFPQQIKRRRFPLEPIEVERKLGIDSGEQNVALILTRLEDRTTCFICQIIAK